MGRSLEYKEQLTPIRKMTSAGLVSKYIVNSVGVFNDSIDINKIFKV